MRITNTTVGRLLAQGSLSIPVFQRAYCWGEGNWELLWDDIVRIWNTWGTDLARWWDEEDKEDEKRLEERFKDYRQPKYIHHLYTIVKDHSRNYILDGQQRLVTITLILRAIEALHPGLTFMVLDGEIDADNNVYNLDRLERTIRNLIFEDGNKGKITLGVDNQEYQKLLETPEKAKESQLRRGYEFFYKRLEEKTRKYCQQIARIIYAHLSISLATTEEGENAAQIFQRINATGVPLSLADKVRSYILLELQSREQEKLYRRYWHPMEEDFRKKESESPVKLKDENTYLDNFITNYIRLVSRHDGNYSEFTKYWDDKEKGGHLDKFGTLYRYSQIYSGLLLEPTVQNITSFVTSDSGWAKEQANAFAERIFQTRACTEDSVLGRHVFTPYFITAYEDRNRIGADALCHALQHVETFIFRRRVCNFASNVLRDLSLSLHKNACNAMSKKNIGYSQAVLEALAGTEEGFPNNTDFTESLRQQWLAYKSRGFARYVLASLCSTNDQHAPFSSIFSRIYGNKDGLTIEHIRPQKGTSPNWTEEAYAEELLHTIGNLTLLSGRLNSKERNKPYTEKHSTLTGTRAGRLPLNNLPKPNPKKANGGWDAEAILERGESLCEKALAIWQCPEGSQQKAKTRTETPISGFVYSKGTKPRGFRYGSKTVGSVSFQATFTHLINFLLEQLDQEEIDSIPSKSIVLRKSLAEFTETQQSSGDIVSFANDQLFGFKGKSPDALLKDIRKLYENVGRPDLLSQIYIVL